MEGVLFLFSTNDAAAWTKEAKIINAKQYETMELAYHTKHNWGTCAPIEILRPCLSMHKGTHSVRHAAFQSTHSDFTTTAIVSHSTQVVQSIRPCTTLCSTLLGLKDTTISFCMLQLIPLSLQSPIRVLVMSGSLGSLSLSLETRKPRWYTAILWKKEMQTRKQQYPETSGRPACITATKPVEYSLTFLSSSLYNVVSVAQM